MNKSCKSEIGASYLISHYYQLYNCLRFSVNEFQYHTFSKRYLNLLQDNKKFQHTHSGERCFVLANGPSIKKENLELLKGETLFTVNQMIRSEQLKKLKPRYHIWADPAYFNGAMNKEEELEFLDIFERTCSLDHKIITFVPLSAYNFLDKHICAKNKRIAYFDNSLIFHDNYNQDLDFSKPVPAFQNIVQYAVALAIYMGFKEIYLLGVDSTGIISKINTKLTGSLNNCYVYELDGKDQKFVKTLYDRYSIEEQFYGWAKTFHIYCQLYHYCSERDIKLVNCCLDSIIETIPQKSLDYVIGKKGNFNENN